MPEAPRVRVAGSLWSVPAPEQAAQAARAVAAGLRTLHWDCSDGRFAAPGGFGPEAAARLTAATGAGAEAHLMVVDPLAHVDAWTEFCELVVVHAEADRWREALDRVAARGATPGLALSPGTPASAAPAGCPAVLVMSVVPGRAGSAFLPSSLATVRDLRSGRPQRPVRRWVGLDGGVGDEQAAAGLDDGADWLVSGTTLFAAPDLPSLLRRWHG